MDRSENAVLTNMCMVCDDKGNVLVLDKTDPAYHGITFPGGHVEKEESFTDAVIREIFEETGLTVRRPQLCGIKQWQQEETGARYIVLLYKTTQFSGTLCASEEGRVFWTPLTNCTRCTLLRTWQTCCMFSPMITSANFIICRKAALNMF